MNIWQNPLFIIAVSTGLIFIITAFISTKYPPKNINQIYGYRTKSSMKSKERWDFAQEYSMDLMKKYGVYLIIIGVLAYFTSFSVVVSTFIGVGALIILTIGLIYNTERAIKDKFGEE